MLARTCGDEARWDAAGHLERVEAGDDQPGGDQDVALAHPGPSVDQVQDEAADEEDEIEALGEGEGGDTTAFTRIINF